MKPVGRLNQCPVGKTEIALDCGGNLSLAGQTVYQHIDYQISGRDGISIVSVVLRTVP
jgi:hypothetical protein